jgi:hypothetical protein
MNRMNFACQRKRWLRASVVATLVSLNLAPAQAQDFTQQLAGFQTVLCRRPGRPQIEPQNRHKKFGRAAIWRDSQQHPLLTFKN